MSLIGILTATEKQVLPGRLHIQPIQWHLENHWRIPESLAKVIMIPESLHPMMASGSKCNSRSATTPTQPSSSDLYRHFKRRPGRSFRRTHGSVCPTMVNPDLVLQDSGGPHSLTHSKPAECGSRQATHARLDHSDIVVPPSRGLVAPSSNRPICTEVQP